MDWKKYSNYFKESEFTCKCGCGMNNMDETFMDEFYDARICAGVPFAINSGCRCEKHNKAEGGSVTSSHLKGIAVDIKCTDDISRQKIVVALIKAGFRRVGIGKNFIHVDNDTSKPDAIWLY